MKRAANQPITDLTLFGGIFLKLWTVPDAGTLLPQHAHETDHISFVVSGTVRVFCEDRMLGQFIGPATVKIAARTKHSFLTLTDAVCIACVHALDSEDVPIHEEHHLVTDAAS